ncbi:MAG: peptide chain release factor 3 [Arthrobacter sp.]|uniref:peptide chain release factor 3 n=1 Tax=unclassified Arthrobacter TaxID=235627 RepID=UPI002654A656|nr:peptide chain release factor 3 [Micrococcaceae bacterium]MDN5824025.1 peptide chain release factor 3 [Micrococcaceae bacterium]MDN5879157.1 peptide chain release factor 3 [Micrococcaceae bacterium]MDN5886633.1 peptide chain release factor 3 [Micrococcaceae bacterium]MDN5906159.1 peptide chain release factor 3 [Micrococcaceae bacterium]
MSQIPTQAADPRIIDQSSRRRTFAVISHPDAGKSTLTEALALHARVIGTAGATNGKSNRKDTVSDWMQMEKDRGISISSTALQFEYRDTVINLVDTPGHADFSEDTYRVLAAVDCAVMLIDAAKGLEVQTMKLFEVCRQRNLPIITVINKWDRPGLESLELMDEITERTGLRPMPLTWAVGIAGEFHGVADLRKNEYVRFTRNSSGASLALEEHFTPEQALEAEGQLWSDALDEASLLESPGGFDLESFHAGTATPVLYSSAAQNFGVRQILDTLVDLAPSAAPRADADGEVRPVDAPFSGFVFKVQAGMNQAHRDHVAFIRVCSGIFERGMVVTHANTGKPFATKYAQHLFGRDREVIDQAWPGDVVGLVNASALRVGDSLYEDAPVTYPPIPYFSPEHFRVAHAKDPSRYKQFRRGIDQLEHEGIIQVLRSDRRGDQAPVLAAVGPMQFEVVEDRMAQDFNAPMRMEALGYSLARLTTKEAVTALAPVRGVEVIIRSDGEYLALFNDVWALRRVTKNHPDLPLTRIGVDQDAAV